MFSCIIYEKGDLNSPWIPFTVMFVKFDRLHMLRDAILQNFLIHKIINFLWLNDSEMTSEHDKSKDVVTTIHIFSHITQTFETYLEVSCNIQMFKIG